MGDTAPEKRKDNCNPAHLRHININEPKFDQETYWGRAQHFFKVTNPLNCLLSNAKLEESKRVVTQFRKCQLTDNISEDELWDYKYMYDSAYHPDTGEQLVTIGRMSAQVPANMVITAGMMTFYKTNAALFFWQWINQTFNATVNYSNRSGDAVITTKQLGITYICATVSAVGTAIGLKNFAKRLPPITGRFVPFVAVAAANAINIPCMRSQEISSGTPIFDKDGNRCGLSSNAAVSGIVQVFFSRIAMAAPGMLCCPVIMNELEKRPFLKSRPWMNLPVQLALVGSFLVFATPLACAFFKQKAEIKFASLEKSLQADIKKKYGEKVPEKFFYNKGL